MRRKVRIGFVLLLPLLFAGISVGADDDDESIIGLDEDAQQRDKLRDKQQELRDRMDGLFGEMHQVYSRRRMKPQYRCNKRRAAIQKSADRGAATPSSLYDLYHVDTMLMEDALFRLVDDYAALFVRYHRSTYEPCGFHDAIDREKRWLSRWVTGGLNRRFMGHFEAAVEKACLVETVISSVFGSPGKPSAPPAAPAP